MKITPTKITKLREYFDVNGVSYEVVYWEDNRYNLHVDLEYVKLSFLTSEGSYGGLEGLIEVYNFRDEPTGYLTADEAIEVYEKTESNSSDLVGYRKESEEIEVENIEWLKEEITEILFTGKRDGTNYFYYRDLKEKIYNAIDQLEEIEVLSQEFIDKHAEYYEYIGHAVVPVDELQNLIVPKKEELESRVKVLIEAYRQEEGAYGERENGWISGFIKDLKNLVEEEQKYYALVKGHELTKDEGDWTPKYWNFNMLDKSLFVGSRLFNHDRYLTEMSKSEWNKLGINDSNADFLKVEEV